jgi:hypothetical protein
MLNHKNLHVTVRTEVHLGRSFEIPIEVTVQIMVFWLWCRVVLSADTDFSKKHAALLPTESIPQPRIAQPWRWRQHIIPKPEYLPTRTDDIVTQKTTIYAIRWRISSEWTVSSVLWKIPSLSRSFSVTVVWRHHVLSIPHRAGNTITELCLTTCENEIELSVLPILWAHGRLSNRSYRLILTALALNRTSSLYTRKPARHSRISSANATLRSP